MDTVNNTADLVQIIQLAVAPVFLLAGIAGFLNVMSARLGRIIDRARVIEVRIAQLHHPEQLEVSREEMKILWRRVHLINWSIGLCTASALLVCILIVSLFLVGFWILNGGFLIGGFFVAALTFLIAALFLFLKEVQLATRTLRFGREFSVDK